MSLSRTVTLLGAPSDCNSSHLRGPAAAPAAVRRVLFGGMSNLTAENGVDLEDPTVFVDGGDLALENGPSDHERIVEASRRAFGRGPVVFLGGDHSVTWPILRGLREARGAAPHLVHFDAHPDLYPDFGGNPHSHASPMARILEGNLAESLVQVGVRTINAVQRGQIERYGVRAFDPSSLDAAAAALPAGPVYVSIDLDALDPAFAPGVSHHEPGGLSVRDVLGLLRRLPGPVVGGDIVEYNPARDLNEMTAAVTVKLLKELVARIAGDRP